MNNFSKVLFFRNFFYIFLIFSLLIWFYGAKIYIFFVKTKFFKTFFYNAP